MQYRQLFARWVYASLLTFAAAHAAQAQQQAIPYVVRDLFTLPSPVPGNYSPSAVVSMGNYAYFAATSSVNGRELWRTDGTSAGTTLVRDINPGTADSAPANLTACNGVLYFTADDGTHGRRLWRTDGTPWNTRMVVDSTGAPPPVPGSIAAAGSNLFFPVAGTLIDVYDGSTLTSIIPIGSCCASSGACTQTTSSACTNTLGNIWAGLGTACATTACNQPIRLSCCMPDKSCVYLASTACTAAGGTPGNPNTACAGCPDPALFACCTNNVCSVGSVAACHGNLLFLITACSPDPCAVTMSACCLPSGECFMLSYASDCTARSGTMLAAGQTCVPATYPTSCTQPTFACCRTTGLCTVGSPSACTSSRGILQPMGAACASVSCLQPNTIDVSPNTGHPYALGNRAIILATGTTGPWQIWASDGTPQGTSRLAIGPTSGFQLDSGPQAGLPMVVGNRLFFTTGYSGSPPYQLWASDGTAAGTGPVADLSGVQVTTGACGVGATIYFIGLDAAGQGQVFRYDGTPTGLLQLTNFVLPIGQVGDLTAVGSGVMFSVRGSDQYWRWWYSDGSVAGTHLVGPPGTDHLAQPPNVFATLGNSILFPASNPSTGSNLWVSDGTSAGTTILFPSINPTNFSAHNGLVYFMASPSDHNEPNVLWSTDGTGTNTHIVAHIQGGNDSALTELAAGANNDLFFAGQSATQGIELFKTSGTPGSTVMVKDIVPGAGDSNPAQLTYNNGVLLFNARPTLGANPVLQRSDGTAAGTFALGSAAPNCCGGSSASVGVGLGNLLVYSDVSAATGRELFRTDGTTAGTALISEIVPGPADGVYSGPTPIAFNGMVFFTGVGGVYRSDGTAPGTIRLLSIPEGTASATRFFATSSGVFFYNNVGGMYFTDGTVTGTRALGPIYNDPTTWTTTGSALFFAGYTGPAGWELWTCDGLAAPRMVAEVVPGNVGGSTDFDTIRYLVPYGNQVYYGVIPANGSGGPPTWYVSDGTAVGTHLAFTSADFPHAVEGMFRAGPYLLVASQDTTPTARRDLWLYSVSFASMLNLTAQDTTYWINYPFVNPTLAGQTLYYTRYESGYYFHGLYRSDLASNSPVQVAATVGAGYNPGTIGSALFPVGSDVLFTTYSGNSGQPGGQVQRTNFPNTGVSTVIDFAPISGPTNLVAVGNSVYFSAQTGPFGWQLFITDGTTAGTRMLGPVNAAAPQQAAQIIRSAGPLFYFTADGTTLWRSDGTIGGTLSVARFASGIQLSQSAELNSLLYFPGSDLATGAEIWQSDGSITGTRLAADLVPGANSGAPSLITRVGSSLYCTGYAFNGAASLGRQPYISDGTSAGSHIVAALNANGDSSPTSYTDLNGLAIFVATNYTVNGVLNSAELFRSDGTAAGTYLLRDIKPGTGSSNPRGLTRAGNYMFFCADDGIHGRELWRTDGTTAGTVMVRDICLGDLGSQPSNITAAGNNVYFTAYTPETGVEPWTSDGTAEGTFMLFEIIPGPSSANIRNLTRAGDRLYFLATVPPTQPALYSFDWAGGLVSGFNCPADYNRSGALTVQDIFDFLYDWFNGASRSDVDGDGVLAVADIFAFLSRWFAGC